ncbi:hypothetical protein ABIE06_003486 [Pantoea dispersa]|nr:hypothetical protein [Pantoea dispersa]
MQVGTTLTLLCLSDADLRKAADRCGIPLPRRRAKNNPNLKACQTIPTYLHTAYA